MKLLILMVVIILLIKFPPGTSFNWNLGNSTVSFPFGWCLWVSVVLSVFMSITGK